MKIAVTSQNFRTVTGHAGRARRFLVYDVPPNGEPVLADRLDLPKDMAMHDFHGDGPHPLDGADVVLSEGFGDGFAQRMAKRGIAVATTAETDPLAAVKAYIARVPGEAAATATCGCGHGPSHEGHGHEGHGHAHGRHGHHHQGARVRASEAAEEKGRDG